MNSAVKRIVSSEMWKKSAVLGWLGYLAIIGRFLWTGEDVGMGMVGLVTLTLGIGHGAQLGKRATEWKPTEKAQADRIKNGGKAPDDDQLG